MNEEIINKLARESGVSPHTIRGLSVDKFQLLLKLILMKRNYKSWLRDQEEKALLPKKRIKKHILLESRKAINGLEVSNNLGRMTWHEAISACKNLGTGWRLPTKDELNMLYENKEEIGGFADNYYWSSTEFGFNDAWRQGFGNGFQDSDDKEVSGYVRAVRAS